MKKIAILISLLMLCIPLFPQTMNVYKKDRTTAVFQLSQIDSITFAVTQQPPVKGFTGDFLAWTGSSDPQHYFKLVKINGKDGTVTDIGGNDFFTSLDYSPSGTLYGIVSDLHIIEPTTGNTVKIGSFSYGNQTYILMTEAVFSPDGTLYVRAALSDSVFTVDLNTAKLTYVGKPTALVSALEFDANKTLFAAFADLFNLNASNLATIKKIGSTGQYISQMSFGNGGSLFGMDIYPSNAIFSLNLNSGLAAKITTLGCSDCVSLVAERTSGKSTLSYAMSAGSSSHYRSTDELLNLEKQHKLFHEKKRMIKY